MSSPLANKRVVITRPESQSSGFIQMLRDSGAVPVIFPTIEIAPLADPLELDNALRSLRAYDWVIFTSVNGVRITLDRMSALKIPLLDLHIPRVGVIGPATAAELSRAGIPIAVQPEEYVAEGIFAALSTSRPVAGQRFLLLRADIARASLRDLLNANGATVSEIPVYRTVRGQPDAASFAALRAGVDIITFTSSSTVRYFFDLLGSDAHSVAHGALIACIGPITAQTARDFGLAVDLVAGEYTIPGLMTALTEKLTL